MNSDSIWNQQSRTWWSKAIIYHVSGGVAALWLGLLLGAMGSLLPGSMRVVSAALLSGIGVVVGMLEMTGRSRNVIQCDRETPRRWLLYGPWQWAIINGVAIGSGFTSRVGFWLWYLVPASCVLFGRPWLGAAIFGTYGMCRTGMIWPLLALQRMLPYLELDLWLAQQRVRGRFLSGVMLVVVCGTASVIVGL